MIRKSIFAGFGGQGVLLMGYLTALAAMREGKRVTYLPAYGAEMRGGTANCTVAVGDEEIASPVASEPDILVVMNNPSLLKFATRVKPGGTVLVNSSLVTAELRREDIRWIRVPATELAQEQGEVRSANVFTVGVLAQISGLVGLEALDRALGETGLGKKPKVLELNRRVLAAGAEWGRRLDAEGGTSA